MHFAVRGLLLEKKELHFIKIQWAQCDRVTMCRRQCNVMVLTDVDTTSCRSGVPSVETVNYLSITSNLFIIIIIKYNIKTLKNDVIYVLVSTVKIVLFTELIHSVFFQCP